MIYVRSASEGKVKVDFVEVKAVSKPDATNIAEAVCSIMDSEVSTDWKNKLVALTTDGASVMTGVNNGVVTKLRAERPYVLGIHCMAHKLELAFSDGIRKNVMARKVEDLLNFGDEEVNKLISHFRPLLLSAGVDVELIPDQWTILKTELYTAGFSQGNFEKTCPTVNRMLRYQCPDVLDLFDALLTIPATTADCERGFSVMKQVKSDWCSRLKGETPSDLLKTQLCSSDIKDFDPSKAIDIWHADSLRSRRPEFVRKHWTKGTEGGSDSDGGSEEISLESSEDI
ncbi:hypothetical protein ABVT39_022499 [Epinephelus coioides]